jgi:hypothetical protein
MSFVHCENCRKEYEIPHGFNDWYCSEECSVEKELLSTDAPDATLAAGMACPMCQRGQYCEMNAEIEAAKAFVAERGDGTPDEMELYASIAASFADERTAALQRENAALRHVSRELALLGGRLWDARRISVIEADVFLAALRLLDGPALTDAKGGEGSKGD